MEFDEFSNILRNLDTKHVVMDSDELLNWVKASPAQFHVSDITTDKFAQYRYTMALESMVERLHILQRVDGRRGSYKPVDRDSTEMDLVNANDEPIEISLPFEMSNLVEIYPGNIIILAGSKSAGKTSVCLNMIRDNENLFQDIHYFNSEMGPPELKKRLSFFQRTIDMWPNLHAYSRSSDFGANVKPGEGNLNIVDFLECHEDFAQIGGKIRDIHDNLKGAVCVIAIQKNPGLDLPLGGNRAIEKARLVITLDKGVVKIFDAKNWRTEVNPNGLKLEFKLVQGTTISYRRTDKGKPQWYTGETE